MGEITCRLGLKVKGRDQIRILSYGLGLTILRSRAERKYYKYGPFNRKIKSMTHRGPVLTTTLYMNHNEAF